MKDNSKHPNFNVVVFLLGLCEPITLWLMVASIERRAPTIASILHPSVYGYKPFMWFVVFLLESVAVISAFFYIRKKPEIRKSFFFGSFFAGCLLPICVMQGIQFFLFFYDVIEGFGSGIKYNIVLDNAFSEWGTLSGGAILITFYVGLCLVPSKWKKVGQEFEVREKTDGDICYEEADIQIEESRKTIKKRARILGLLILFLIVALLAERPILNNLTFSERVKCFAVDQDERVYIGVKNQIVVYENSVHVDTLELPELKKDYCFIIPYRKLIIGDSRIPNGNAKEYDVKGNYLSESHYKNSEIKEKSQVDTIRVQNNTYVLRPSTTTRSATISCNDRVIYTAPERKSCLTSAHYYVLRDIILITFSISILVTLCDRKIIEAVLTLKDAKKENRYSKTRE